MHLALRRDAPETTLLELLSAHPEAVRLADRSKCFPLHLALEHDAAESVVIALLRAHPEGSRHADQSMRFLLHLATIHVAADDRWIRDMTETESEEENEHELLDKLEREYQLSSW